MFRYSLQTRNTNHAQATHTIFLTHVHDTQTMFSTQRQPIHILLTTHIKALQNHEQGIHEQHFFCLSSFH